MATVFLELTEKMFRSKFDEILFRLLDFRYQKKENPRIVFRSVVQELFDFVQNAPYIYNVRRYETDIAINPRARTKCYARGSESFIIVRANSPIMKITDTRNSKAALVLSLLRPLQTLVLLSAGPRLRQIAILHRE